MTQEDKELLRKDLCSRLPYGVKAKFGNSKPLKITNIGQFQSSNHDIKPYPLLLLSMTKVQEDELGISHLLTL